MVPNIVVLRRRAHWAGALIFGYPEIFDDLECFSMTAGRLVSWPGATGPFGKVSALILRSARRARLEGWPRVRPMPVAILRDGAIEIGCCRFRTLNLPKSGKPDF